MGQSFDSDDLHTCYLCIEFQKWYNLFGIMLLFICLHFTLDTPLIAPVSITFFIRVFYRVLLGTHSSVKCAAFILDVDSAFVLPTIVILFRHFCLLQAHHKDRYRLCQCFREPCVCRECDARHIPAGRQFDRILWWIAATARRCHVAIGIYFLCC